MLKPRLTGRFANEFLGPRNEPGTPLRTSAGSRQFVQISSWPPTWWWNLLLFLLTLLTTTAFGFSLVQSFWGGHLFEIDSIVAGYTRLAHGDRDIWTGVYFSVPLMLILLAHELGHYITSLRWRVNASLPYFLPSPLLFGTFGAFIRIRSPIYTRKALFDIGVSGPVAGVTVLLPFLVAGVWMSRVVRGVGEGGTLTFGVPAFLRLIEWLRFPGVPAADIALHPMAMAAWAGLLATAINLLPIGQSDGGHILYAALGERWHRVVSTVMTAALLLLGFLYPAWWIWAVLMFFFGRHHPLVYDQTPLTGNRLALAGVAMILFALSISIVPVRVG